MIQFSAHSTPSAKTMAKSSKTKVSLKSNLAPKLLLSWPNASINSLVWLANSRKILLLKIIMEKKNMSLKTVEMDMAVFYAQVV